MKSAAVAVVLMASAAMAQPHGNHRRHQHHHNAKRDLVVEWETTWVTVTEIVDATGTETISPSATPEASSTTSIGVAAGQFFQTSQPIAAAAEPTVVSTSTSTSTTAPVVETTQAAPAPSTTTEAAPVVAESSSTSTTAAATSTSSSSGEEKRTGDITYYAVGMGSCGYNDGGKDNSMNIVAVSAEYFKAISPLTSYGENQPANPLCDKTITMSASNGKTTTAVIRDSCPGCSYDSIDVSEKAFIELFSDLGIGRTTITWWLNN